MKKTVLIMGCMAFCARVAFRFPIETAQMMYGAGRCKVKGKLLAAAADNGPPYVVAIDPGHGDTDTGAESHAIELTVCEMTADYLYRLLKEDKNFSPVFTRAKGEDPDSTRRAAVANNAGADVFISIHANSDSSPSSGGFECFPVPPGRENHSRSMKLAQLIAREMKRRGHRLRGGEEKTGIKFAYYSGKVKKIVDSSQTKVRSLPSFGVLEKSACPRVLVEQCFVTNYSDVENWTGESGCKKAAEVYYRALKKYFDL